MANASPLTVARLAHTYRVWLLYRHTDELSAEAAKSRLERGIVLRSKRTTDGEWSEMTAIVVRAFDRIAYNDCVASSVVMAIARCHYSRSTPIF